MTSAVQGTVSKDSRNCLQFCHCNEVMIYFSVSVCQLEMRIKAVSWLWPLCPALTQHLSCQYLATSRRHNCTTSACFHSQNISSRLTSAKHQRNIFLQIQRYYNKKWISVSREAKSSLVPAPDDIHINARINVVIKKELNFHKNDVVIEIIVKLVFKRQSQI